MDILIKKSRTSSQNKKTKEKNRLEKSKRKKERAALEWGDLDMQAEFKSFMYVDRSLRAKKDKLIDELDFKKCTQLKRSLKSKLFVGITNKQRNILFILILWLPTKKSQISLFRISKVTQTRFMT